MQKNPADITREMALEMIEYLDQTLTAANALRDRNVFERVPFSIC
jgi:hypothetical protein